MTAAPILDSFESLQGAVSDFLKHLNNGGLGALDEDEVIELARDVEALRRQLKTADYPLIAEIDSQGLAQHYAARNTATLLSLLWRVTPHEAHARVREAGQLGERVTLTGELLEPLRPAAAAARADGVLGTAATAVILKTLDTLPKDLPVEEVAAAEQTLVHAAHALNPIDLRNLGQRLVDTVNPDGAQPDDEHQQRRRELSFRDEYDGMIRLSGVLDPATGAKAHALIHALAAPRPEDATGRDERTPGQRRHDALGQLLDLGLRAERHAGGAGAAAMVHVTMTAEQFQTGTGHAVTTFGQRIRVADAFKMLDQACVGWDVHFD